MLKTIQIITLLQGFFLMLVLIKRRHEYQKVNFWLLICTILSVQAYALGDDDFNLFVDNADWFFFYDILFITFFFLLIKYRGNTSGKFRQKDLIFFLPYIVFIVVKSLEYVIEIPKVIMIVGSFVLMTASVGYMVYIVKKVIESKEKWLIYFVIPYSIVFLIDHLGFIITRRHDSIPFLESYGVIGLTAVLLYIILYRLIISPTAVIPKIEVKKYKDSNLDTERIKVYQNQLKQLFEVDKVFINNKLTVTDVAKEMQIPRQHLSELFSVHLNTNFQDYLNGYRVEEFIKNLQNPDYQNFTLLGIAKEVGFNSKTSFYTTFKKLKGMTPLEYKKAMITQ